MPCIQLRYLHAKMFSGRVHFDKTFSLKDNIIRANELNARKLTNEKKLETGEIEMNKFFNFPLFAFLTAFYEDFEPLDNAQFNSVIDLILVILLF
jgi:hypothetical protein